MRQHPLILQLDMAGNPMNWVTYQTAAIYIAKNLVSYKFGDDGYTIYGGDNRITLSQSFMDLSPIMAVKGDVGHKHLSRAPTLTNQTLFRRDQHLCAYCGIVFAEAKLTRDHVIPKSRGGKDIWTNVVTACAKCNMHKDARTPEEAKMKLLYVPYTINKSEQLILKNRNILACQMEFLISRVSKDSRLLNPIVA